MKSILSLSVIVVASIGLFSCGTTKKQLKEAQAKIALADSLHNITKKNLNDCKDSCAKLQNKNTLLNDQLGLLNDQIKNLKDQISSEKVSTDRVFNQLKDLSVISSSQAESIKKSLDNIGVKDAYIKNLQSAMNRKDSLNLALVTNLKGAIGNLDDKDINIKVEKGVVYIDISDKMLFKTGRYDITDAAREVLGKVAKVLLAHPDIDFIVEGHTDNVPFKEGVLEDNWDLSAKRATTVVRLLQNTYHIAPAHMTAAGRGEYVPVQSNDTEGGRATNRRTRIIIIPQLDQFFQLLQKPSN
jgi:chemotaxis protein MotB